MKIEENNEVAKVEKKWTRIRFCKNGDENFDLIPSTPLDSASHCTTPCAVHQGWPFIEKKNH